jgi:hypothetical protein
MKLCTARALSRRAAAISACNSSGVRSEKGYLGEAVILIFLIEELRYHGK